MKKELVTEKHASKNPSGEVVRAFSGRRSASPCCVMSPDGLVTSCNSTMLTRFKREASAVIGHPCREVFGCSTPLSNGCVLGRVKTSLRREVSSHTNGSKYDEVAEPLLDASGALCGVVLSLQPRAPSVVPNLAKLHRLEAIAQATGGVVHDLNNIFTRVAGGIAILKARLEMGEANIASDPLLADIEIATEQGVAIAHQLLDFGKGNAVEKSDVSVNEVIEKALSFSLIGSTIQPMVEVQSDLWRVRANAEQMKQIVSNLVTNAVHALDKHAAIRIVAANVPKAAAHNIGLAAKNFVRIAVEDNGIGIPPDHIDHVFEPFFTTKKEGTGLGLAMAALIVKEHGGRIGVESEVGRGTVFTVHIPASEN